MYFSLGLSCIGLWTSWIWMVISFPKLGKFLTIISSNIFSCLFSPSSSGTLIIHMLVCLMLFQRSLRLSSFLYIYIFSLFCSASVLSTILSSRSLTHFSGSNSLLRLHRHHSTEDKTSRLMMKTTLKCQEHPKKLTHLQKEERKKRMKKKKERKKIRNI